MTEGSVRAERAVVLARGLGTRLRAADPSALLDPAQEAAAAAGLKALVPLGRPFLDHQLSSLADAGIGKVCLVVGEEHGAIREHVSRLSLSRLTVDFAVQRRPLGTADAVLAAETFAGDDEFLALNGDTLYPAVDLGALASLGGPGTVLFTRRGLIRSGNVPAERVLGFAVASVLPDGTLGEILEKPTEAEVASLGGEPLVSANCWRFPKAIFEACRRVRPSPRAELELPDAVRIAVRELGVSFRVLRSEAGVLDLSTRADVAGLLARLSEREVSL